MANQLYAHARFQMVNAQFQWPNMLLNVFAFTGPQVFVDTDLTVSDILARAPGTMLGYSDPITGKTTSPGGVMQSDPALIRGIPIGPPVSYLTMCEASVTPEASQLIFYMDEGYELPFVPNGLDIMVHPDWLQMRGWGQP